MPEPTRLLLEARYAKLCELLPRMKCAGVSIMAETDTGDPYTFPGYDLHRQLELLVQAGLTPLDALPSATLKRPGIAMRRARLERSNADWTRISSFSVTIR